MRAAVFATSVEGKVCKMRTICLLTAIAALVALALVPASGQQHYEAQPADKDSTLVDWQGYQMTGCEFGNYARQAMLQYGSDHYTSGIFLFQECYGGGMLDDLKANLDPLTDTPWVGGSASKWDEESYGQSTPAESGVKTTDGHYIVNNPGGFWTGPEWSPQSQVLAYQFGACGQALITSINNARGNDKYGVGNTSDGKEEGQSVFSNGGDTILLTDTRAEERVAILWAGEADCMRHFNNIKQVRDKLKSCWAYTGIGYRIIVLYGDGQHVTCCGGEYDDQPLPEEWGAMPATLDNLRAWIMVAGLRAELLFYATDHGGSVKRVVYDPDKPIVFPHTTVNKDFSIDPGELEGIYFVRHSPSVVMDFSGSVEPNTMQVRFNSVTLGWLQYGQTHAEFVMDGDIVQYPENTISIVNSGNGSITINRLEFYTGGVDPPPTFLAAAAKAWPDGARVGPIGHVVTAVFGDDFYVESRDRAGGLKVRKVGHGRAVGDKVDVLGVIQTDSGFERYVQAAHVIDEGTGSITPLGIRSRFVGGSDWRYDATSGAGQKGPTGCAAGLNNIGLLVRSWGKVLGASGTQFSIRDTTSGSSLKCVVPAGVSIPAVGSYVAVTGISSCEKPSTNVLRVLKVRTQDDIRAF